MERFLDSRGIEYSQAQDGSGNWSHIFRLKECPNADHHSHERSGAAIFVDEATQRAGFNCFHAHCEELKWKDVRRLIDPGFSFRLERAPEENPIPEGGDKLKPRGVRGNTEQERAIMRWASAEFNRAANYRFRKRLRRAAACGRAHQELECSDGCGPRGIRLTPCDDPALCRYCSVRRAYLIREHAKETWTQVAWFRVQVKAGDYEAHRSERERIKKLFQGTGAYPRWVTGWDHIDFFLPSDKKGYARSLSPEGGWKVKIISSAEAADMAANAWLTLHQECMAIIASAETAEDINELLKIEWVKRAGPHRTGGGRGACEQLPWFSLAEARAIAKEQALEKRGGVPLDCCGNEIAPGCFCRQPMNSTLIFSPTGEKISKRFRSMFNDEECIEYLDRTPIEESYYKKTQRFNRRLE